MDPPSRNEQEFEKLVQDYMHNTRYTTTTQATCNVVYAIINAGIVMLPFAASASGIGLFSVFLPLASILSGYTSVMLVKMASDRSVRSYEELGELAFGVKGYFVVSFLEISFSTLIMIITLNVFGDIISDFIDAMGRGHLHGWIHHLVTRNAVIVGGAVLVLPRCFSPTMPRLWLNALVSASSLLLGIIAIMYIFFSEPHIDADINPVRISSQWWVSLGIIFFSVSYQQKVFLVYNCMRRRTPIRWARSVLRGHIIVCLAYTIFGCLGFVYYQRVAKNDVAPDYFSTYSKHFSRDMKIVFDVARVAMAFSFLFTLPVDCLVSVNTIKKIRQRQWLASGDSAASARHHDYSAVASEDIPVDPRVGTDRLVRNSDMSDITRTSAATTVRNMVWSPDNLAGQKLSKVQCTGATEHVLSLSGSSLLDGYRRGSSIGFNEHTNSDDSDDDGDDSTAGEEFGTELKSTGFASHVIPVLCVWAVSVTLSVFVREWPLFVATVGTLLACLLALLLPSILYFRLGVTSDYQAIPIFGIILPNKLLMLLVQVVSVIFFSGNIVKIILILSTPREFHNLYAT